MAWSNDNFPVVLTIAIELLNRETLLYTKKQQIAAGSKLPQLQETHHLVNYNDIHDKMLPLRSSDKGSSDAQGSTVPCNGAI